MNYHNLNHFFNFVISRQEAHLVKIGKIKKEDLQQDYISEVISEYRFCNVYRKQDKGSIWFERFVNEGNLNIREFIMASLVYRMIGWVPTFVNHFCGQVPVNPKQLKTFIEILDSLDEKKFTDRYMTTVSKKAIIEFCNKPQNIMRLADKIEFTKDGFELAEITMELPFVGKFFATQFVADYLSYYKNSHIGLESIVPVCIGSYKASMFIDGKQLPDVSPVKIKRSDLKVMLEIMNTQGKYFFVAGKMFMPKMTYVDIEHALCEYYRFIEILNKDGVGFKKYLPATSMEVNL